MPDDRDVKAFNDRAPGYEAGWLGQLHHDIANRAVNLALATAPDARRVLDVGSGTGYVLRQLAGRLPTATELTGVDPAPEMIRVAREAATDGRLRFVEGTAEHLPAPGGAFDLVISTTSFDHWADQAAGLAECARVLVSGGHLVLTDQFSVSLWPTLVGSRRGKARTRGRVTPLITSAGLRFPQWHRLYAVIIQTATTVK